MVDILRTAASSVGAFQRALATTGHNIANANTPGFSRQRAGLVAAPPQTLAPGLFIGTGVRVGGIERVFDAFLTQQVRSHSASFQQLDTVQGLIDQVAALVGDAANGPTRSLEAFFAAVGDLADDPASVPARQVVLARGESLAARVQDLDRRLADIGDGVNRQLRDTVNEINGLTGAIAAANADIALAAGGPDGSPNDLLDHRDRLLADLARRVAIQTVTDSDGNVSVFVGNGQALVVGHDASRLALDRSPFDPQAAALRLDSQRPGSDLSATLSGGRLGGLLAFRDEVLDPARNALGLLAVGLADTFNARHRQGIDLNGNAGQDFFAAGPPRTFSHADNAGTATVTAAIADAGRLTRADYQLTATAGGFLLRRLDNGAETTLSGSGPFTVDGLTLTVSGAAAGGDRFLIQPTRNGAAGFALLAAGTEAIAAAAPIRTGESPGNQGSGQISPGAVVDASDPNLRRAVDIVFTDSATFDVVDVASGAVLAAGQAYSSGA
ncbi:MAG: flagellar hook-associated protein FlgK, partial [Pseudomonadota bacterium]|nr:flagellar hook-associated protein FlgK [Pseudomonadota bacterium]